MAALSIRFAALYARLTAEKRRRRANERLQALAIAEFAELYGDDSSDDDSDGSYGSNLVCSETDYSRDSDCLGESDYD